MQIRLHVNFSMMIKFHNDSSNFDVFWTCHLDRALNVKIGVECQIFVIVIFLNYGRVLQIWVHSRYYMGVLTQIRSFLVTYTTFRSDFHVGWKNKNKYSTPNLSINALFKCHDPYISYRELKLILVSMHKAICLLMSWPNILVWPHF